MGGALGFFWHTSYHPAIHIASFNFQAFSKFKLQTVVPKRELEKMDQTDNQKKQSPSQFINSQFHRKLTQLLLSVSVFSLFFSRSYWLSLFNFHNSLPFQLFSHAIDKNCIFLLFNGLLVFLANYSGLISSSSKYNLSDDQSFKSYEYVPQSELIVMEPKSPLLEQEAALESDETETETKAAAAAETENFNLEDGEKWSLIRSGEEEEENVAFVAEYEQELQTSDDEFLVQDIGESENYGREEEEEEEEEEEIELVEGNKVLSKEELNKKFDEFIRKMKEELRIEARQQLVMV
ncbi:hypothetical protein DITRI_Ditri14bG0147200 [Diplodiscus trichospermus]